MVSRRNFFSITTMMIVLFCMFQVPQVIKERINDYATNDMIQESNLKSEDVWKYETSDYGVQKEYGLFIGSEESKIGNAVMQWGSYRKQNIIVSSALQDFDKYNNEAPGIILIESEYLDLEKDIAKLRQFAENGTTVIFCNLPSYEQIKRNSELQELLGIKTLRKSNVEVEGYHLYEGFLLGGETIYKVETEDDKDKQDMNLELPWYYLGTGTEVYMSGIMQDDNAQETDIDREFWPAAIWSHSQGAGKVFAVNGDYISESMGVGILSAMIYTAREYDVYPVVDSQILTVANFPGFADENTEYMQDTFNSSMTQVCRDAIYPQLLATAEQSGFKVTYMLQPQYDYEDENEPKKSQLSFYLKSFKEQEYEAGLALDYKAGTDLEDKLSQDEEYFTAVENQYVFSTAYTVREKLEKVLGEEAVLKNLKTMVCYDSQMQSLLGYCTDDVTVLSITDDAYEHTYTDDLRLKSLETALGYSNILLDMKRVLWPEKSEESWEKLAIDFSSNLSTYWKPFQKFSDVTVSEADIRVREFLSLDYTHMREGNEIHVYIDKPGKESRFLLRTHGEEIVKVTGATYEEIEEDVYLICTERGNITIEVNSVSMLSK